MVKCENCKYSMINEGQRYCLRHPPTPRLENPASSGYMSVYPKVEDNYRCGEGEE